MPLSTRVIACLDVDAGRVVKGVNFENLRDVGDPVALSKSYGDQGIDELIFLDISASVEDRTTMLDVVRATADTIFIPLTVGGGVRQLEDVDQLLRAGADKVSLNTAAIKNPLLLAEISQKFGAQVIVLSADIKRSKTTKSGFELTTHGGKVSTGMDAFEWIATASKHGIGEVLINSMDHDGTGKGFDIELISTIREITNLPLIASGGAGNIIDFVPAVLAGADAVLAASVFHFNQITISEVKQSLKSANCLVRN
jgi:cyclase